MHRYVAAAVTATAAAAIACADTTTPPAGNARPAGAPHGAPAAATAACLTVPPSTHPGCYHSAPRPAPSPRSSATGADADASLTKEAISGVVRSHLVAIKCCYESQLGISPHLTGSVVLGWAIEPSGSVSQAWVVERTLDSSAVVDCIGEEICGWQFPTADVRTTIGRYPFGFKN